VERQREADDHMRRYLHHLAHNTKSETLNGLIIVGAGGTAQTRRIKDALEAECVGKRFQQHWESHNRSRGSGIRLEQLVGWLYPRKR